MNSHEENTDIKEEKWIRIKKSWNKNLKKFSKPLVKILSWLYETWIILIFLVFLGVIFYFICKIWLIKLISGIHISDKWLTYMFSTGDGHHFQWVGISTILAVIAFIFNAIWNKKNFNADIKSKSRIDWMKTVRNNYSEFLLDAKQLHLLIKDFESTNDTIIKLKDLKNVTIRSNEDGEIENADEHFRKVGEERDDRIKELKKYRTGLVKSINEYNVKMRKENYSLKLYVPEESNERIIGAVQDIWSILSEEVSRKVTPEPILLKPGSKTNNPFFISKNTENKYNPSESKEFKNFDNFINECIKLGSEYFKDEWDRAKEGK